MVRLKMTVALLVDFLYLTLRLECIYTASVLIGAHSWCHI